MNKKEASSPLSLRRTPITPSRSRGRVRNNKGRRLGLAAASTPLFSNHTTGRVETVTTNTANVEEEEVEVIDNENEEEEIEVMGVKRPSLLIQERLHCADKSGQVVSLVDTPDKIKTTVKTTVVVDKENTEVEDKQKRSSSLTAMVSNPPRDAMEVPRSTLLTSRRNHRRLRLRWSAARDVVELRRVLYLLGVKPVASVSLLLLL